MEVMSSLLLCALVGLLPQALGKHMIRNDSLLIQQKPSSVHKLLLNVNAQPLVLKVSELQSVFNDYACSKCVTCMERAIKAHKTHTKVFSMRPTAEDMHRDTLTNKITRDKRDTDTDDNEKDIKNEKKAKSKKNIIHKSVTVTKYNLDGKVYALKVKESIENHNGQISDSTCQVYSIKKSFPCDSPDGHLILTAAKRKINKKGKSVTDKTTETTPAKKPSSVAVFRKRQVDNTQLPENFMPSVEEFY